MANGTDKRGKRRAGEAREVRKMERWMERDGSTGRKAEEGNEGEEREENGEKQAWRWRRGGGGEFGKGRSGTWATHYLLTSLLRLACCACEYAPDVVPFVCASPLMLGSRAS